MKKILGFLLPILGLIGAGAGLIYLKRKQLLSQGALPTIPSGNANTGQRILPGVANKGITPSGNPTYLLTPQAQWKTDTLYPDKGLGGYFVYDKTINQWVFFLGNIPASFYTGANAKANPNMPEKVIIK